MTFGFPWYLSILPALVSGLLLLTGTFLPSDLRERNGAVIAGFLELRGTPVVRQP